MYSALGATVHTHKFRAGERRAVHTTESGDDVNEALVLSTWLVCVHKYTYTHTCNI